LAHTNLLRLKKAGFQLIALIDDLCASGGYMLASACDMIICAEYATIGSIGVAATIGNYHGASQKIGVIQKTIATGPYKRPCPPCEPLEEQDIQRVNESIQETMTIFKDIVQKARKLTEEE